MSPFRLLFLPLAFTLFTLASAPAAGQEPAGQQLASDPAAGQEPAGSPIYWGNEVPVGWTGEWPDELRTVAEKTDFRRTMTVADLHHFIDELRWRSEHVHVLNVFRSPLGRMAPAVMLVYDAHRMGQGNYAYVNSTVPAAHPGPRGYVRDTPFPAVRDAVRREAPKEPSEEPGQGR